MKNAGNICLLLALAGFLIFFADVALGAMRAGDFLNDIAEMLTLLAVAVMFVVGILTKESEQKTHQGRTEN